MITIEPKTVREYYYSKKIQPENYLPDNIKHKEKYQPFEIGCWGSNFEDARAETLKCIQNEIDRVIRIHTNNLKK